VLLTLSVVGLYAAFWLYNLWKEPDFESLSLRRDIDIHGWSAPQVQDLQQQTANVLKRNVEFQDTLNDGSQGPVIVVIPGGLFMMGSPETEPGRVGDEERQHQVQVAAFAISKYELTVGQFRRFVEATGYQTAVEKTAVVTTGGGVKVSKMLIRLGAIQASRKRITSR
jgi:formylglycine-generating enzyme required for sulfatase activity